MKRNPLVAGLIACMVSLVVGLGLVAIGVPLIIAVIVEIPVGMIAGLFMTSYFSRYAYNEKVKKLETK